MTRNQTGHDCGHRCEREPLRVPGVHRWWRQVESVTGGKLPTPEQGWLAVDLTTLDDAARVAHERGEPQLELQLRALHERLARAPSQ